MEGHTDAGGKVWTSKTGKVGWSFIDSSTLLCIVKPSSGNLKGFSGKDKWLTTMGTLKRKFKFTEKQGIGIC